MKNKKFTLRSEKLFLNVSIACPKHGPARVYKLSNEKGDKAIGCQKCFESLKIL